MSSLNKFKEKIINQIELYEYMFALSITAPAGSKFDPNLTELKDLDFYVNTATLPGKTLERADVFHFGMNFKKPSKVVFTDTISMDMRVDADLKNHKAISKWMDTFYGLASGANADRTLPLYNLRLHVLDQNLNPIEGSSTIVCVGVYPSNLGDISMSHEGSAIAIAPVEFTLQYWYHEDSSLPANGDPLG